MITILQGDVVEKLRELQDKSVHCVVTSPPYYGLRDYQVAGQIGLEDTPEEYVKKLVGVFREVKRVLRDDGTLWLNLGDSYWANRAENGEMGGLGKTAKAGREQQGRAGCGKHQSIKPKDMIGIPWRVAFALQADGWYLRSDIIWNKPNPMPESVTDRPTKSHEYIFLLTKKARYFYDADTIREPISESYANDKRPPGVIRQRFYPNSKYLTEDYGSEQFKPKHKNLMEDGQPLQTMHLNRVLKQDLTGNPTYTGFNDRYAAKMARNGTNIPGHSGNFKADGTPICDGITRNARTVWTITTQARPEAHFATFPDEIPRRCIKAGTSEYGCCPKCGAPYQRIIEASGGTIGESWHPHENDAVTGQKLSEEMHKISRDGTYKREQKGWQPGCKCPSEAPCIAPCIVLDPFGGSGTTGEMARELKRDCILIELNPEYIKIMKNRLRLNEQLVSE